MIRSSVGVSRVEWFFALFFALSFGVNSRSAFGQQASSQEPGPPLTATVPSEGSISEGPLTGRSETGRSETGRSETGGLLGGSEIGATIAAEDYVLPPELKEEADKSMADFKRLRDKLEQAIVQQRNIYIRYINGDEKSVDAADRYRLQRNKVREVMNELYFAALRLFQYVPDQFAAQYIATMIQHHAGRDIYDAPTLEGGVKLINAGVRLLYLFKVSARSAVVVGDFELAKKLYDFFEFDEMDDVDRVFSSRMDEFEANYDLEQPILEKEAAEDRLPRVRLETTRGEVVLELFLDSAPSTVANFIDLVENGFYDGVDFHQVIDHLLALTGDPSGSGSGDTGRLLVDEHTRPDARKAFRGSLVMAKVPRGEGGDLYPHSASCQFAILFLPQLQVTGQQTVFGRVIEGMDVISSMQRIDPSKKKDKKKAMQAPDRIITAEVIRRPDTLPEAVYVK